MTTNKLLVPGVRLPRGTNLPRMGDFNQSVILDAIRRSPSGLSRVELSAATRLSAQTISNICRRLLDLGYIREAGKEAFGPGKPRTILRLDATGRYAIGVHLDPTVITSVMLDLVGNIVVHSRKPTPTAMEPKRIISAIVKETQRLIHESGVERDRIAGIGIAAPGPIDFGRGAVVDPPNLSGWHHVTLRDALSEATGLPALLDKDVTAAAVAEMWAASEGESNRFSFFYLGTGIGVGTVIDGDVLRGTSGNAGEIGHIVVDSKGPLCSCGQYGCLAVTCTPLSLVEEAEQLGILGGARPGTDTRAVDRSLTELCNAARSGDIVASKLMERSVERMSRAVAVIANLLDVDRVVFGGPMWARQEPFYLPRMTELLEEMRATRNIHSLTVAGTTVGDDVGAVGAACLILDRALTPRPDALLLTD
jgi:predicted NBD/HSP70 family sugar kinase